MLLAENVFTAFLYRQGNLHALHQISTRIVSFRHLIIFMVSGDKPRQSLLCHDHAVSLPQGKSWTCDSHKRQYMKLTHLELRDTLEFIMNNMQPNTLELGLTLSGVGDIEMAEWLVAPLAGKYAKRLAGSAISFGAHNNFTAWEIARKYAMHAMAKQTTIHGAPFRFMFLPPELRRHILSFTGLVVSGAKVEWLRRGVYRVDFREYGEAGCGREMFNSGIFTQGPCLQRASYCSEFGSGYSQYCRCWFPPTAILLCSRQVYCEAMSVFLDMNEFSETTDSAIFERRADPRSRNEEYV